MITTLIICGIGIAILWVLNIVISPGLKKRVGQDDPYFKKVVGNGNNLFFCLLGLVGVAVSWYFVEQLKWIILIIFGLFILWDIFSVVVGAITTLGVKLKYKENIDNDIVVWISNLFALIGTALVLYPTCHYLFGWF